MAAGAVLGGRKAGQAALEPGSRRLNWRRRLGSGAGPRRRTTKGGCCCCAGPNRRTLVSRRVCELSLAQRVRQRAHNLLL